MVIEISKPNFLAGNEKRFSNFISNLNEKDKIAIISHRSDLDGVASAKITNEVIKADLIKFVSYNEINDSLADQMKKNKINKIIITDLYVKNEILLKKIESFSEILIIDHHMFEKDWNSEKTVFINARGYCAAYLAYYLFSKIQNLEKYDWLIASASVSDWCYTENSSWMIKIYEKYNQNFIPDIEGIKKSSFFEYITKFSYALIYSDNDASLIYPLINEKFEIGKLGKSANIIENEIKNEIERFDKEKEEFGDIIFYEIKSKFPLSSFISTHLSSKKFNKTFIIGQKIGEIFKLSARRQDKMKDMNKLTKELINGFENSDAGGHFAASGASFNIKHLFEFKKRLEILSK